MYSNFSDKHTTNRDPSVGVFGISPSLDRSLEARLLNNLKAHPPPNSNSNSNTPSSLSHSILDRNKNKDQDLLTVMASRLAKLEDTIQALKVEASYKEKEQGKTELKYKKDVERLESENCLLKDQIHQMETFLNDYGLVWVGTTSEEIEQLSNNMNPPDATQSEDVYQEGVDEVQISQLKVDMEKIKHNIGELNILAGEGKAEVVTKGGMRRLKEPDPVSLTFYSNGFVLLEGPFRPYNVPSSLPFIKDIMDGYFPYELKEKYPDGVPFKLIDRSSELYLPKQPFSGTRLDNNIHSLNSLTNRHQTKEDFLKKLPTTVVRNGRVIDIRQSVATNIFKSNGGSNCGVVVASTDVINYMRGADNVDKDLQSLSKSEPISPPDNEANIFAQEYKGRPTTPQTITTLKIKTHTIGTLIVKLKFDDTVGTLKKYIDQYTEDNRPYELRTSFPNRVYSDVNATLRASGLVPNATLYVKCL